MKGPVLLILFFSMTMVQAQPIARHNLYHFNPNFANPAATGMLTCIEFAASDMHQWAGITDAPNVQSFSVQKGMPFSINKKNGLGINLIRDSNGPSKSLGGEFLYSFHLLIGRSRTTWLSFGLSGNFEQRRLDESGFSPVFDPQITGASVEEIVYNASGGVYVYNDRYFGGLAVYNLLPVNNSLGLGYGGDRYYLSFQGGYLFDLHNSAFTLATSIQGGVGTAVYQFDLNNKLLFKSNLWAGLTLRKYLGEFETAGQNALVFLGYDWDDWGLSYNYNIDINGTQFHHYGTHQLTLCYRLCSDDFSCPAYR